MFWIMAIIHIEAEQKISSQFILVVLHHQSQKPLTITELRITLSCSSIFTVLGVEDKKAQSASHPLDLVLVAEDKVAPLGISTGG